MNIPARRSAVAAFAIALLAATQAPALAAPDGGPPMSPTPGDADSCPLERIGTQLVKCDLLTGAGVPASEWVPEYGSTIPLT